MELTESYQYLGRSNGVGCASGYRYYVLIYARGVGDPESGTYRVDIKTRMACSADASFYAFTTTGSASAGGVSAYSWTRQQIPAVYWGDSSSLTEGGFTYPRWTELYEGSATVATGFGTDTEIEVKASWVMNSTLDRGWFPNTGEYATASIPVTLPALAGASTAKLSGNGVTAAGHPLVVADGADKLVLSITPGSASFTHRVEYTMGGQCLARYTGITTGHTFVPDPALWLPYITDRKNTAALAASASPAVRVITCNASGTPIGGEVELRFDIAVPDSYGPKITVTGITPVNPAPDPFAGLFLQGITGAKVSFTAKSDYGAEIKDTFVTLEGIRYGAQQDYSCQVLSGYGTKTVKVTATDSRGFTGTATAQLQVIPYSMPQVSGLCQRAAEDGTLTDSGSFVQLSASASVSRIPVDGENRNSCQLYLRWRQAGSGSWTQWVQLAQGNSFEGLVPDFTADPKVSYTLQLQARDGIGSVLTELSLGTEEVYMHRTSNALGLGKYVEGQHLLDCAWDAWFRGTVYLGEAGQTLEEYISSIIAGGK